VAGRNLLSCRALLTPSSPKMIAASVRDTLRELDSRLTDLRGYL
jgi:hypothetical protein